MLQWTVKALLVFLNVEVELPALPQPEPVLMQQRCMGTVFGTPGDKLDGDVAACGGAPLTEFTFGIAHRRLPCGTKVRVINPKNRRSVVAKVVDRGPYGAGTRGHDWYIKRQEHEAPPKSICTKVGDEACAPRPWRGCVDMLPSVGNAIGIKGRAEVRLLVLELAKTRRQKGKK